MKITAMQNRIIEIEHELKAISIKSIAMTSGGVLGGLIGGVRGKSGFWKTLGIMVVGSSAANIVARLVYSDKAQKLLAEKNTLENKIFNIKIIK